MYTFLIVLIIITALLLAFLVLIQNSQGGGLAAGFSSSNQIMGVRKTTDFLEKATWTLAIALVVFSIATVAFRPGEKHGGSEIMEHAQEAVDFDTGFNPGFAEEVEIEE